MGIELGKEFVKKIAFVYLVIILAPLKLNADIIFFKDGMKTVCHDRAWEENGDIKCEYNGTTLTYQKNDVLRIEKIKTDEESEQPLDNSGALPQTTPAPAEGPPGAKQAGSENKFKIHTIKDGGIKTKGLEFYNPRRPQKYWTSETAKHNTFKEAINALAKAYDRSQEWNKPAEVKTLDAEKASEILFYNPRRPQKYWTSETAKHNTFKEAINALAKAYDRSQEWIILMIFTEI
jgi:hypothetical protein